MDRRFATLAVALALAACTGQEAGPQATPDGEPASGEDAGATASCLPVEAPPLQGGGHLLGDQEPPVPYSSVPPTSGWHASGAVPIEVHGPDDPLPESRQVSVLEAGAVVVTYHDLDDRTRATLVEHVRDRHPGRVTVTPYERLDPGQVAFTAWGTLQRCDGLDRDELDAFVAAHADDEPGVPGDH